MCDVFATCGQSARVRIFRIAFVAAKQSRLNHPPVISDPPPNREQTPLQALNLSQWFNDEVHPHGGQLKAYLRKSFPSVHDVEDVVQDSYLRVWKARAAQPILSAKAFLFKVARHLALDTIRRARRSPIEAVSDLSQLGVIDDKLDAAALASLREKIEALTDAVAALPERRRTIVILRKFKCLSQTEVAAQLGVTERTVENQLYRGIRQCEEFLHLRGIESLHGEKKA